MPPLGLPRLSVDPVGFWAFWLGGLRDYSGNGNHGVNSGCFWRQTGGRDEVKFSAGNRIDISDDVSLRLARGTIIVLGKFDDFANDDRLVSFASAADDANIKYEFLIDSTTELALFDTGGAAKAIAVVNWAGANMLAVTFADGEKPNFYVDDGAAVLGSMSQSFTAASANMKIGNNAANARAQSNPIWAVIEYPEKLTQAEIASVYDYSQSRITPRKQWPGSGLRYPDRETNLLVDPADAGSWTPSNAALSDDGEWLRVTHDGVNNPQAFQTVLTIGQQVLITGDMRGDGTWAPQILSGGGGLTEVGTPSEVPQPFSILGIADAAELFVRAVATGPGYCEFRNLKVWTNPPGYTPRTGDPLFLDNIQSARVTLADQSSGRLSNTTYQIESGTHSITENADGRYIENVAAGRLSRRNLVADGTWNYRFQRQASGGSTFFVPIITRPNYADSAANGYAIWQQDSGDTMVFVRVDAGGVVVLDTYAGVATGIDYDLRITRSPVGVFIVYLLGGAFTERTEVMGATDNTHTTSLYSSIEYLAGDRLYSDRQFAGVVSPV